MVAYAYAAQYSNEVEKLALLEAPIPGIGDIWEKIYTTPALWHFHYVNSPIALDLVKGRERIFLEHFWQTLSPHPETFSETDRELYATSYEKCPIIVRNSKKPYAIATDVKAAVRFTFASIYSS